MLCEKCGTEIADNSKFCKKCGAPVGELSEVPSQVNVSSAKTEDGGVAVLEREAPARPDTRTSPLAVHIQERLNKDDKKLRKKLLRGRRWAILAIIVLLLFIIENGVIITYELGYLDEYLPEKEVQTEAPAIPTAEKPVPDSGEITPETLDGDWSYTYTLTKYWDADGSGSYAQVTETIVSDGMAEFINRDNSHIAVAILPGNMVVDGTAWQFTAKPEAFSGWFADGNMNIPMSGTEQKFFAPGGAEPITITFAPTNDGGKLCGTYSYTYDKVVSEMNMRYAIEITFTKAE